jgi:hypothetical protein
MILTLSLLAHEFVQVQQGTGSAHFMLAALTFIKRNKQRATESLLLGIDAIETFSCGTCRTVLESPSKTSYPMLNGLQQDASLQDIIDHHFHCDVDRSCDNKDCDSLKLTWPDAPLVADSKAELIAACFSTPNVVTSSDSRRACWAPIVSLIAFANKLFVYVLQPQYDAVIRAELKLNHFCYHTCSCCVQTK